ncbi:MAG: cytochrome P450 [Pseudomonadota bacterium]
MERFSQDPSEPAFVQNPYPAYDRARALGEIVWWEEYGMAAATSHAAVSAILKCRDAGRMPVEAPAVPDHARAFYDVEAHSMLELEPPRHTRLRGLVLRAFNGRRVRELGPEIEALAADLVAALPRTAPFDILEHYARPLPVRIIARLLGVPETMAPELLAWSNCMVAMYQTGRTRAVEEAANRAATEFSSFLRGYVKERRNRPADDLITHLIAAEEDGDRLSTDELITTCILLLNAGHEATVHTLGNGLATMLREGVTEVTEGSVEEILRHDPPLHIFTRHIYGEVEIAGHAFHRGQEVACLLGAANRDPAVFPDPHRFDPEREAGRHVAFGAGLHFCVGAPLARLELLLGLRALPRLRLVAPPVYGDTYHFHGLGALEVARAD